MYVYLFMVRLKKFDKRINFNISSELYSKMFERIYLINKNNGVFDEIPNLSVKKISVGSFIRSALKDKLNNISNEL